MFEKSLHVKMPLVWNYWHFE